MTEPHASTIVWRRLDRLGHDSARLQRLGDGWRLDGAAVFMDPAGPCRLDYVVDCDETFRTSVARVAGWVGTEPVAIEIHADADRHWTMNGRSVPEVAGCEDVDLSITPATNLLPIRRLSLARGARAPVRAAWLAFPELALAPLDQIYQHVSNGRFHYASGNDFTAELETRPDGFVTHYSGLWIAESAA
jgi:hypothetical protein